MGLSRHTLTFAGNTLPILITLYASWNPLLTASPLPVAIDASIARFAPGCIESRCRAFISGVRIAPLGCTTDTVYKSCLKLVGSINFPSFSKNIDALLSTCDCANYYLKTPCNGFFIGDAICNYYTLPREAIAKADLAISTTTPAY